MRFRLSRAAREDLVAIADFVMRESGSAVADRVIDEIFAAMARIAEAPGIGHKRAEIDDDSVRVWHVYEYLILFRPEPRPVAVLRVWHGARAPWRIDDALREADDADIG